MAQSEYSYYSEDDHHDGNKRQKPKSGMTEQNVVPVDIPDLINNMVD